MRITIKTTGAVLLTDELRSFVEAKVGKLGRLLDPSDTTVLAEVELESISESKTADLFRACDLFAFPAVGEIFTLVMQEAMASGLPVVTTDDPAYCESIVSGCIVVSRRDAQSFR